VTYQCCYPRSSKMVFLVIRHRYRTCGSIETRSLSSARSRAPYHGVVRAPSHRPISSCWWTQATRRSTVGDRTFAVAGPRARSEQSARRDPSQLITENSLSLSASADIAVTTFWQCPRSIQTRVYITVRCPSVRLSARLFQHRPTAANSLPQVCCYMRCRSIAARPACDGRMRVVPRCQRTW